MFCLPVPTLIYLREIYILYISRIGLPILLQGNMWIVDRSWKYINRLRMNVEIGTKAAQFPGKDYINGIFLAL
jgi:hypothetical protein